MSKAPATFWGEFRRNFHDTGSILPSSRFLAQALSRQLCSPFRDHAQTPWHILEIGPGTGAVTEWIVRRLGPHDSFDLVESNATFVRHLAQRFEEERELSQVANRVRLWEQRVEELRPAHQYDLIISGLPLNNFSNQHVDELLDLFPRLLKPGSCFSFFEYVAIRRLKALLSPPSERRRLRGIGESIQRFLSCGRASQEVVWLNLPPALVHHVELTGGDPARSLLADCGGPGPLGIVADG